MGQPKIKRPALVVEPQETGAGIREIGDRDHHYLVKLRRLAEQGVLPRGEAHCAQIAHDDWCGIYRGDLCDCDPFIYLGEQRIG
jgi:hypothetical protein